MEKYLVRRAPSPGQSRQKNDSRAKRAKTEHEHDDPSGREDDDAESSGADGGFGLVGGSYDGMPFEEPLASIESLEDMMGGSVEDEADGADGADGGADKTQQRTLYRSSIYVDAFNIALDTVLEQEAHLFDDKEGAVFDAWRQLDYEAQYLYVRLFLRKQAAWHRTARLGYHSDIGDLPAAVAALQRERDLSAYSEDSAQPTVLSGAVPQDWSLGSSFAFAQALDDVDMSPDEAIGLLSLDELRLMAKQAKAVGKSKAELQAAIVRVTTKQLTLMSAGLRLRSSTDAAAAWAPASPCASRPALRRSSSTSSGREEELVAKVMAITGPCIRICPTVFKLFERIHLVFYRTSEWTEKSLTTIVLAKMSKRSFPDYVVSRTANIFASRQQLLDFEEALRLQYRVDQILNSDGQPGEDGHRQVVALFDSIAGHWRGLVEEELGTAQSGRHDEYEYGEHSYLRRFRASHVLTRVAHYAAYCMGRLHEYRNEHALLDELLGQRLLHLARRGAWYQRKALIEERYMAAADPESGRQDKEQQKKLWWRRALATCETALEDRDCHLIFHHDLQKRIVKLERRLRIPRRLQHDFGHLRLLEPEEHFVEGTQIRRAEGGLAKKASPYVVERTIWMGSGAEEVKDEVKDEVKEEDDEEDKAGTRKSDGSGNSSAECTVEEMCLSDYRRKGWKGYHAEGGIVRTLFAYLFYDVLFLPIPNVFQTAYQACPLDLHTDVFYAARASEINRRLVEIANGEAPRIVRAVHDAHFARRTCIVGLRWEFAADDVVELAECFRGDALALVCKVMAQEYRQRGGGLPDLLLWRKEPAPQVLFAEVKSANDRLSDTQRMWIHVLAGAGVRVAVCHAIAKETRVR